MFKLNEKDVKKSIRIGSGQGFWGDLPIAPIKQARLGHIDYLVMDYLAEVTMSIMQKQKLRNSNLGYARDFVGVVSELLPDIKEKGLKIISNAGGVNPLACKDAILKEAEAQNIKITIAVVHGDDILENMDNLIADGHEMKNMETGEPITTVKEKLLSANIYFGAEPIIEALKQGADVVVTGRVTDTGLTLAPMVYEFDWDTENMDLMATGTLAGHIIECGAQCTGGNFTDWRLVEDFTNIGFPIIEAYPDGTFYVTKHENSDGLVTTATVKEQLLYEIGDPSEYITPDCIVDFTSVNVDDGGKNRVKVFSVKGKPKTEFYKVSASYLDGYKLTSSLVYTWPEAISKAKTAGELLKKRANALGLNIGEFNMELVGLNACSELPLDVEDEDAINEIQLRISAISNNKEDLNRLGMEIAPLILTGPSSVTGFAGGRPKASEIVAYWPALIKKSATEPKVSIFSNAV